MRTMDTLKTNIRVDIDGFNRRYSDDVIIKWSEDDDNRFPGYGYYIVACLPWYHGREHTVVSEFLNAMQALNEARKMKNEIDYYYENN